MKTQKYKIGGAHVHNLKNIPQQFHENRITGVGGVADKRFRDVQTYGRTDVRTEGNPICPAPLRGGA